MGGLNPQKRPATDGPASEMSIELNGGLLFQAPPPAQQPQPHQAGAQEEDGGGDGNENRLIGAEDGIMGIAAGSLPLEPQGIVPDKIGGPRYPCNCSPRKGAITSPDHGGSPVAVGDVALYR